MKQLGILVTAVTVAGVGLFTVSQVSAQTPTLTPQESLIAKIATKFQLNQDDVKKVFDDHHAEVRSQMHARYEEYLSGLVAEGKITNEQKSLLLNKRKELESQFLQDKSSLKELTREERRQKMEAKRTELDTWAKQHSIDPQYLMGPIGLKGKGHGMHDKMH